MDGYIGVESLNCPPKNPYSVVANSGVEDHADVDADVDLNIDMYADVCTDTVRTVLSLC